MGMFERAAVEARSRLETTSAKHPAYWLQKLFGGQTTSSGIAVGEEEALSVSALYSGNRVIAEDLAAMPLPIYQKVGKSRERAEGHPWYRALNRAANPEMSAMTFREVVQGHAGLWGNGFAEIDFANFNLWPLLPGRMRRARNGRNGLAVAGAPRDKLFWIYTLPDGSSKVFDTSKVFNLRGHSRDGIRGYSLLRQAAETIGLDIAAQTYGGAFFDNDAAPSGYLSVQGTLGDEGHDHIQTSWAEAHEGLDNAHRFAILEEGAKYERVGVPPNEAQFLETRQYGVREFARWLRLAPTFLQDLGDATYSNVEHLSVDYVKFTLTPWAVRWQQEASRALLGPSGEFFAELVMEAILRGDSASRSQFYHQMQLDGNLTRAGVARLENTPMPTDALADVAMVQLAMVPVTAFDENGMTLKDRATIAGVYVRAGWDPDEVLTALNLPAMKHTGLVPVTVTIDPTKLPDAQPAQE